MLIKVLNIAITKDYDNERLLGRELIIKSAELKVENIEFKIQNGNSDSIHQFGIVYVSHYSFGYIRR